MIIKLFALLLLLPPFSSALDPNSTLPCPLPSLPLRVAQYYPTYTDQTPAQVQWAYADLAFFFVLETNSTGLGPADTNLAQEFVATAVSGICTALCPSGRQRQKLS